MPCCSNTCGHRELCAQSRRQALLQQQGHQQQLLVLAWPEGQAVPALVLLLVAAGPVLQGAVLQVTAAQ